jgi:hypothetical protein
MVFAVASRDIKQAHHTKDALSLQECITEMASGGP